MILSYCLSLRNWCSNTLKSLEIRVSKSDPESGLTGNPLPERLYCYSYSSSLLLLPSSAFFFAPAPATAPAAAAVTATATAAAAAAAAFLCY